MKRLFLFLSLLLTLAVHAQTILTAEGLAAFGTNAVSGGGGGGWTLLASTIKANADGNSVTTDAIDTTGATLIVIVEASNNSHPTPTESTGANTVNLAVTGGSTPQCSIYYINPGTHTSATHKFTASAVNAFPVLAVFAYSGGIGTLDKTANSGPDGSGSTIQPGSITPSQNGCLIVSGMRFSTGTSATVNSGFSTPLSATAFSVGGSGAYLIQGTAAAINPTWTQTSSGNCMSAIADFKP